MRSQGNPALRDSFCSSNNRTMTVCVSVLAALVLGIGILCALAAGPLHAQCFVEWYVGYSITSDTCLINVCMSRLFLISRNIYYITLFKFTYCIYCAAAVTITNPSYV